MRWRIYYGDEGGTVYDGNCAAHAYRAPNLNVQVLKEESSIEPLGYFPYHGCKVFVWLDEPIPRWSGRGDEFGFHDYYFQHTGPQKVIWGRDAYGPMFQRIMKQVKSDGNFEEMNFQAGKKHRG